MRSLANYEAANKKLETAKLKNKGVTEAETNQQTCSSKFEKLSETGKQGLWCICNYVCFIYVLQCLYRVTIL